MCFVASVAHAVFKAWNSSDANDECVKRAGRIERNAAVATRAKATEGNAEARVERTSGPGERRLASRPAKPKQQVCLDSAVRNTESDIDRREQHACRRCPGERSNSSAQKTSSAAGQARRQEHAYDHGGAVKRTKGTRNRARLGPYGKKKWHRPTEVLVASPSKG